MTSCSDRSIPAPEENEIRHRAAPCVGTESEGPIICRRDVKKPTAPAENATSHAICMNYMVLGPPATD